MNEICMWCGTRPENTSGPCCVAAKLQGERDEARVALADLVELKEAADDGMWTPDGKARWVSAWDEARRIVATLD